MFELLSNGVVFRPLATVSVSGSADITIEGRIRIRDHSLNMGGGPPNSSQLFEGAPLIFSQLLRGGRLFCLRFST